MLGVAQVRRCCWSTRRAATCTSRPRRTPVPKPTAAKRRWRRSTSAAWSTPVSALRTWPSSPPTISRSHSIPLFIYLTVFVCFLPFQVLHFIFFIYFHFLYFVKQAYSVFFLSLSVNWVVFLNLKKMCRFHYLGNLLSYFVFIFHVFFLI